MTPEGLRNIRTLEGLARRCESWQVNWPAEPALASDIDSLIRWLPTSPSSSSASSSSSSPCSSSASSVTRQWSPSLLSSQIAYVCQSLLPLHLHWQCNLRPVENGRHDDLLPEAVPWQWDSFGEVAIATGDDDHDGDSDVDDDHDGDGDSDGDGDGDGDGDQPEATCRLAVRWQWASFGEVGGGAGRLCSWSEFSDSFYDLLQWQKTDLAQQRGKACIETVDLKLGSPNVWCDFHHSTLKS